MFTSKLFILFVILLYSLDTDEWSNFNKYTFNDVSDENVEYNFAVSIKITCTFFDSQACFRHENILNTTCDML